IFSWFFMLLLSSSSSITLKTFFPYNQIKDLLTFEFHFKNDFNGINGLFLQQITQLKKQRKINLP
ncbi:MAG TPA: hypothetical protein VEV44_01080, partial [Pseudoneobacillus sp.]|nr:hypothetical protein [Pseudoneobacillus sp.]